MSCFDLIDFRDVKTNFYKINAGRKVSARLCFSFMLELSDNYTYTTVSRKVALSGNKMINIFAVLVIEHIYMISSDRHVSF